MRYKMKNEEVVYITYDQALDLVDRIEERASQFDYEMSKPEKEAMADFLSSVGVKVSDLIDISNLADNYAINAEFVTPEVVGDYSKKFLEEAIFTWKENGETFYCVQW